MAGVLGVSLFANGLITPVRASSHMDAPSIVFDDPANTTDVYAFVTTRNGRKFLSMALAVYPFEEPGIGPNKYNFDDNVLYELHVVTGAGNLATGQATYSYQFRFNTRFKNRQTILQSFSGVIQNVDDAAQNLTQTYTVTKVEHLPHGRDRRTRLDVVPNPEQAALGLTRPTVPPNNQGNATPFYNLGDNGENLAKPGVERGQPLDRYTNQTVFELSDGSRVFAGQREDGFYADVQSVFDLLRLRGGPNRFDSQSGFNVHVIAINVPVDTIGGDQQIAGVYATTSRRRVTVLRDGADDGTATLGDFVQVGRQGNPLFCEVFVALEDKDRYNRTKPTVDNALFRRYAENPEPAFLANALIFGSSDPANTPLQATGRTDLAAIFIPDIIKVDLSTQPARLAGGGRNAQPTPDDPGFSRLGIFGGFVNDPDFGDKVLDVLQSRIPGAGFLGQGIQPGGWPNGRRFGDDVVTIGLLALACDLRDPANPQIPTQAVRDAGIPLEALTDGIEKNDSVYNKVLPYAATPHNGRNYRHNPQQPPQFPIIN
jgi:hypothetical protein